MCCLFPLRRAAPKMVQITLGDTDVLVANPSVTQNITVVRSEAEKQELLVKLYKSLFMDTAGAAAKGAWGAGRGGRR